jgi:hypothetical protein
MADNASYVLEKAVWTEADYPLMGWHDSWIHGFGILNDEVSSWKNELLLDIDYIFQWVQPEPPSSYFTFWVAPCTLRFFNFYDLTINADLGGEAMEIADLNLLEKITGRDDEATYYGWNIELQGGSIQFKARGFKQIVRRFPIHTSAQTLSPSERGGLSFDEAPCQ